jgi:Uma2 family endonuclease
MSPNPRTLDVMSADVTPWIRHPDPLGFTVDDLHTLPDDGLRYELIDGSLIVSPSATGGHNLIARWIANALEAVAPDPQWIVSTDQSAIIDDHNEPRPDLVVYHGKHVSTTPFPIGDALLVGEVVSPHSVLRDTETKRSLYARAGVPAYWIVVTDPDKQEISIEELRLDDGGRYRYATHYSGDVFVTDHPWPVTVDLPRLSARWGAILDITGDHLAGDEEG